MIEIDRLLMEDFGIDMIILMENAGKAVARVVRELRPPRDGLVLCLAGKGNNGGGGLVAARHLHNWGADVVVVLPESRTALKETPRRQLAILERMGLPIRSPEQVDPSEVAVVVDALRGTGRRAIRGSPLHQPFGKRTRVPCPSLRSIFRRA